MAEHVEYRTSSRSGPAVTDLTLIVKPPGKPTLIRVFTDAEEAEAQAYAANHETTVERLNVEQPDEDKARTEADHDDDSI